MLRDSKAFLSISLILVLCFGFQTVGVTAVLFEDDFENDTIGQEPQNWEYDPAAEVPNVGQVSLDPLDPNNQVFTDYGGYWASNGAEFADFVAEWDWMFFEDDNRNNSIGFRVQSATAHYQLSRRLGGDDWKIYMYDGTWNEIATAFFPTEIDKWYRVQLSVMGNEFIVKVKEKEDGTPFQELAPILEVIDETYDRGVFSTSYYGPIDNVIIADTEEDLLGDCPECAGRFVRGDSDSSGVINITDGIRTLGFLFQSLEAPSCFDAADTDDDGKLSITDAIIIFGWLFRGQAPPANPGPRLDLAVYQEQDCARDPTAEDPELGCEVLSVTCQ